MHAADRGAVDHLPAAAHDLPAALVGAVNEVRGLFRIVEHPNRRWYPNQAVFVVVVAGYVHLVPFVEEPEYIFLKTIIPSRKATREYGIRGEP
jgi:hypothetical protein